MNIHIDKTWEERLTGEFKKPYFKELIKFVDNEYKNQTVYPIYKDIFKAFELCPFNSTKIVILGQDPYHGVNQAMGLSFSVPKTVKIPPSLKNIYKELKSDLDIEPPDSGNLTNWAKQGVLLLNSTLTVRENLARSHQKKGWETFTNEVIRQVNDDLENIVFLLWGNYAKYKGEIIDRNKHLVLEAAHPSPLAAYKGFFGCKHFSKTNEYLKNNSIKEIDWTR